MEVNNAQRVYIDVEKNNKGTAAEVHKKLTYAPPKRHVGTLLYSQEVCKAIDHGDFAFVDAFRNGRHSTSRTDANKIHVDYLIQQHPRLPALQISLQLDLNRQTSV